MYQNDKIAKSWYRTKNNQVKTSHYFHEFERAIEYEAGDIKGNAMEIWLNKYQLISPTILAKLDKAEIEKDCTREYKGKINHQEWQIIWSENLNLPLQVSIQTESSLNTLTLIENTTDPKQLSTFVAQLDRYQSTDYADVGDNESDPFLLKMIRLGFVKHGVSGFYDSKGNL